MSHSKERQWKTGRGKLGLLDPLLGAWRAEASSQVGLIRCVRIFSRALNNKYVLLDATWELPGKQYVEHAVYGVGDSGVLSFWSFTSDGKRSTGLIAEAKDIHPEAIAFEAQMPAGLARMIYWPSAEGGIHWAVESRSKKGWNRFTEHHYLPI